MNEKVIGDGDVVIRELGALRRITLNRPKALNAITLGMAETMTTFMRAWTDDPTVGAVLIDGDGDRAFAVGGDIRALYDAAKSGSDLPAQFWATEYHLNVLIARYPKPVIAIMDGLVMGGGVGLASHAAHRVVTERSSVAMPEVGIGFFPDVGVAYLLVRQYDEAVSAFEKAAEINGGKLVAGLVEECRRESAALKAQQPKAAPAAPGAVVQTGMVMTNELIVKLIDGNVAEEEVLKMIANQPGRFSVEPGDMAKLKAAGVPDAVITAMRNKK